MAPQIPNFSLEAVRNALKDSNDDVAIDLIYCRIKDIFENKNIITTKKKGKQKKPMDFLGSGIDNILKGKTDAVIKRNVKRYNSYEFSYPFIAEYFKCLIEQDDAKKWLIGGASLVYSWMPTALILHTNQKNEAICSLKNIKENKTRAEKIKNMKKMLLDKDCSSIVNAILPLRNCINNSIVGPSKFLHFSFPKIFPIWDSLVANAVYECEYRGSIFTADKQNNKDIRHYVAYAKAVHKVCGDANLMKELDAIPLLKKMESIRKIEHALFLIGHMYKKKTT